MLLAAVLAAEMVLGRHYLPLLIPPADSAPFLVSFPTLAVQVSASLLGFYLASVSIVLGRNYSDVSANVRELVLGNPRSRVYLTAIGFAIGAGLVLVLLHAIGITYGYLSIAVYALVVLFAGWAFVQLALGAFYLFNPLMLSEEPLQDLRRAFERLNKRGLAKQDLSLREAAGRANRSLAILSELIDLTRGRNSTDRQSLAIVVQSLFFLLDTYIQRKHLIPPSSGWFIEHASYPKWVESSYAEVSLGLQTSTTLPPQYEPKVDWLEGQLAELAAAVLDTAIEEDDLNTIVRLGNVIGATLRNMAANYRIDEAVSMARIIGEHCWARRQENEAQVAAASLPPLLVTNILLGWRVAIESWPEEIEKTVGASNWEQPNQGWIQPRGPVRLWRYAASLNREIEAEIEIQGLRTTPDWYLTYALAGESILALREFATQLPSILGDSAARHMANKPDAAVVSGATQALETLAKAEAVVETIMALLPTLESLRLGQDTESADEIGKLAGAIQEQRSSLLISLANVIPRLRPEREKSIPDRFGQVLFLLVHHTEIAIRTGDTNLVTNCFSKLLKATLALFDYVRSTYGPPTYQMNSTVVDPIIDILELSGLALVYEALRDDQSASTIRDAWENYLSSLDNPQQIASYFLNLLDLSEGDFMSGGTSRAVARMEWERQLSAEVKEAGFARPLQFLSNRPPTWSAPLLIKIVGVSEGMPHSQLPARLIFAAEFLGPISGESEEHLRNRLALKRYFDQRDLHVSP